jgi:hypothetical protein
MFPIRGAAGIVDEGLSTISVGASKTCIAEIEPPRLSLA